MSDVSICLPRGNFAVISSDDYESELSAYTLGGKLVRGRPCDMTWRLRPSKNRFYVVVSAKKGGARIELGRLVIGCPAGMFADHKDRNPFNNLRTNLRICTRLQNQANRQVAVSSSGFHGVRLGHGCTDRYVARANYRGATYELGVYGSAEEAAMAYDAFVIEKYGEFARLNFPKELSDPQATVARGS